MSDLSQLSVAAFVNGIRDRNTVIMARAITLLESAVLEHRIKAEHILEQCMPYAGNALRIGITGAPGVGKSTFIEALGQRLLAEQKKIAVLAIDPSSRVNRGSILGDKTRMEQLSRNENVFIRPTASGQTLGGVASATRESIIVLEAAGYDMVIVETVGVGQSETAVYDMTDLFLLLLMAGAGDELQGIKRGIMEMADLVVINKADGENVQRSAMAKADFHRAIQLFEPKASGWQTAVETASSVTGSGLDRVMELIFSFYDTMRKSGYLMQKRKDQMQQWFSESLEDAMVRRFLHNDAAQALVADFRTAINNQSVLPSAAARAVMNALFRD